MKIGQFHKKNTHNLEYKSFFDEIGGKETQRNEKLKSIWERIQSNKRKNEWKY